MAFNTDTALQQIANGAATTRLGSIKSVQQAAITIAIGSSSNTATISSVVIGKSFLIYLGTSHVLTETNVTGAYIQLTNATTVTASRDATGSAACTVAFMVVEFNG